MGTGIDLGRPVSGDVIDLIIDDHRRFERLLRQMRDTGPDRDAVRRAFADVHVAHGLAEEEIVYPVLRRKADTPAFDDAVENLSNLVAHHLAEEELSILRPARGEVSERVRRELGTKWATRRNALVDERCGSLDNVRRIVKEADKEGLLDEE